MRPDGFLTDIRRKPTVLRTLAATVRAANPWAVVLPRDTERVVLLGMGSSAYAGGVAAAALRARGVVAVSELASQPLLPAWGAGTVVVAISAGGESAETLDALDRLPAGTATVALTNVAASTIASRCDAVVTLDAEPEIGGVACRSFTHTAALLLALREWLTDPAARRDATATADTVAAAADAVEHLLVTEPAWRPEVADLLLGPSGTYLAAPAQRLGSAQQGALMLREGPRLAAVGCETGDWSHVDVYLTRTLDYRLLVFAGSPWEGQLAEWTTARGSTVVGVGGDVVGARAVVRYPGDHDDDVRLLTEVVVPELVAARAWAAAG